MPYSDSTEPLELARKRPESGVAHTVSPLGLGGTRADMEPDEPRIWAAPPRRSELTCPDVPHAHVPLAPDGVLRDACVPGIVTGWELRYPKPQSG